MQYIYGTALIAIVEILISIFKNSRKRKDKKNLERIVRNLEKDGFPQTAASIRRNFLV
jgi:hypothetical protein